MVDRISTLSLHQSTLQHASRMQAEIARLQTQISSGFKSQHFDGIASQAEQFLSLEGKLSRSSVYGESNKIVLSRINTTITSLDQIVDTATDIKSLLLQRQSDTSGINGPVFAQQLEGFWRSLTQSLNSNLDGRYLFSGDKTNVAAVGSETFPTLQEIGTPDTSYYGGGNQDVTVQVDDNISMTYNIRADDPAFQKIFAGLAMAKRADIEDNQDMLQQAFDFVKEGIDGVIALQSSANTNKVTLDQISLRQQGLQIYWKSLKEDIGHTDLVAASTQVAIDQGILQASFQTFARINSLSLSDYLQ